MKARSRIAKGTREKEGGNAPDSNAVFKYVIVALLLFSILMVLMISKRQQEGYSQLSLIEKSLPNNLERGTAFTFGFEVQNHEGREAMYEYFIYLDGREQKSSKVVLANEEVRTFFEGLQINEAGPHTVSVSMVGPEGKGYDVFFKIGII